MYVLELQPVRNAFPLDLMHGSVESMEEMCQRLGWLCSTLMDRLNQITRFLSRNKSKLNLFTDKHKFTKFCLVRQ